MILMMGQELPEAAAGQRGRDAGQVQHLGHHQEHDESPIGVQRDQTLRKRRFRGVRGTDRGRNGLRQSWPQFLEVLPCSRVRPRTHGGTMSHSLTMAISAQ